jgi:hypothetical protein
MFSKMKIAVSAALILGAASAALANDVETSVSEAQAVREMHGNPLPWWWNTPAQGRAALGHGGNAFGFAASSMQHEAPSR